MRCAIFGDVHSNYDALEVVLNDIRQAQPDAIYCVGDIVGYGAEPSQCIAAVRALNCAVVAGNHDWAAAGRLGLDYFNAEAAEAITWTSAQLSEDDAAYLRGLELVAATPAGLVVHSTPADPAGFGYVLSLGDATRALDAIQEGVCFVGHSHIPLTFALSDSIHLDARSRIDLKDAVKAIVNVGSVGQPRDHNPKAAYALFDTESKALRIRRLSYDWESAAHKILHAGLPGSNAYRLTLGA